MSESKNDIDGETESFTASPFAAPSFESLRGMWNRKPESPPVLEVPQLMASEAEKLCIACESLLHREEWKSPPAVPEITTHFNEFQTAFIHSAEYAIADLTGRPEYIGNAVATIVDVMRLFLMSEPVVERWKKKETRPGLVGRSETPARAYWVDIIDPSKQPTPVEPSNQSNSDQSAAAGEMISAVEAMYEESGNGNELYESANPTGSGGAYEDATIPEESDAKSAD
jgi:hypothetical protein